MSEEYSESVLLQVELVYYKQVFIILQCPITLCLLYSTIPITTVIICFSYYAWTSYAQSGILASVLSCLWKFNNLKARNSICALILRSSAITVGKLFSSSIRCAILAANLSREMCPLNTAKHKYKTF